MKQSKKSSPFTKCNLHECPVNAHNPGAQERSLSMEPHVFLLAVMVIAWSLVQYQIFPVANNTVITGHFCGQKLRLVDA